MTVYELRKELENIINQNKEVKIVLVEGDNGMIYHVSSNVSEDGSHVYLHGIK